MPSGETASTSASPCYRTRVAARGCSPASPAPQCTLYSDPISRERKMSKWCLWALLLALSVPSFTAASQGSFSWSSPHLTNTLSAALPSIYNCFTQAQCCNQLAELSPKHLKKQESCCFEKLLLETGACHPFISYFHIL